MSEILQDRNRQAQRSIDALQNALQKLMESKPYNKITITEIANESGLTRSTFYAHFETKDDLLHSIISSVVEQFFIQLDERDHRNPNPEQDLKINQSFFKIWRKNKHLINLLSAMDFDCLMIAGFKKYIKESQASYIEKTNSNFSPTLSAYTRSFLAYAYVGFLREWINQGMHPSAERMGELLYHFTGPPVLNASREKFKDKV